MNISELNTTLSLLYHERTKGYGNSNLIFLAEEKLKELISGVTNPALEKTEDEEYYIAHFSGNYADEFDLESFSLMTSSEYYNSKSILENVNFEEDEFYFGTNEQLILSSEELKSDIKFIKITKEQYNTIDNVIGNDFGLLSPTTIIEIINDRYEWLK